MFNIKNFFKKKKNKTDNADDGGDNYKRNFFSNILFIIANTFQSMKKSIKPPKKLSDVDAEGDHYEPSREIGLFKYEREEIPLPGADRIFDERRDKRNLEEQFLKESNIQNYYLYQFVKLEIKQEREKKLADAPKKNLPRLMSIIHFKTLQKLDMMRNQGAGSQLYKINVNQVSIGKSSGQSLSK